MSPITVFRLIFSTAPCCNDSFPHFIDEEVTAQRGYGLVQSCTVSVRAGISHHSSMMTPKQERCSLSCTEAVSSSFRNADSERCCDQPVSGGRRARTRL